MTPLFNPVNSPFCDFKMPHQWENVPSFLPPWKKSFLHMCGFSTHFLFHPFPQNLTHLISNWIKDLRIGSRAKSPGCTVCSEYAHIWLISLFALLRCGPASHGIEGRFENQGMGMTQQQGVQPKFLLAPLSWEPSGRRRGVRSAVESPTCLCTWKAWLTIPFEATGCKGAGHWQVRTKMGLIVRESPRQERAGPGATLKPNSSLSTHWRCLISGHLGRAVY